MDRESLLSGDDWLVTGWYTKQWRMHSSMELNIGFPPMVPPVRARVPGAIPVDLLRAGWLKDPNVGLQSLDMEWVNNRDWVMERRFRVPEGWVLDRAELVFEGLDYSGEIYLNRELVATFEGMFQPVVLDVSHRLRTGTDEDNVLQVVFFTAPYVDGQIGHSHTIRRLKSRFNYAWDWCPRMIPVGIWRDVILRTFAAVKIVDFFPEARLDDGLRQGTLILRHRLEVLHRGTYRARYRMLDDAGREQWTGSWDLEFAGGMREIELMAEVGEVQPWWPNGYGEHSTYRVEMTLLSQDGAICDTASKTVGFRQVTWAQNPGAPGDSLPYTLMVNGRRVFIKGVNWVPPSPFYGTVRPQDYGCYLQRFVAMHANLVRVWGGAIYEHDAFYDECDRRGILVWQEFLQSSSGLTNSPPEDPEFVEQLDAVSRVGILRLRSHPSLVVWCGGNELMWEGRRPVDERHLNIQRLKRLVQELDPGRQFFPTSPSGPRFMVSLDDIGRGVHHDVHGPWGYSGDGAHYTLFNRDDAQLRSETGAAGAARRESIERYAGHFAVWPPTKANPYWLHRGAWWIPWEELGRMFGPWNEERNQLGSFLQASRYLQLEALRYAAEATRRREPAAAGFMVWMGNEPFPNNVNTSLLEFDGTPKPAYYAVQRAFGPRHVSVAYDRIAYRSGERFVGRIFVHGEAAGTLSGSIWARLIAVDGAVLTEAEYAVGGEAPWEEVGMVVWEVKPSVHSVFLLRVQWRDATGRQLARNDYLFTIDAPHPLEPLRGLPPAHVDLSAGKSSGELVLTNLSSEVLAVGVFLYGQDAAQFLGFEPNAVTILPAEQAVIQCSEPSAGPERVKIEWFNQEEVDAWR